MNIKAYIKTKSASSIQEVTPSTELINIQSVNNTIQVRDKSSTENYGEGTPETFYGQIASDYLGG